MAGSKAYLDEVARLEAEKEHLDPDDVAGMRRINDKITEVIDRARVKTKRHKRKGII